jgi:hypothetical protein
MSDTAAYVHKPQVVHITDRIKPWTPGDIDSSGLLPLLAMGFEKSFAGDFIAGEASPKNAAINCSKRGNSFTKRLHQQGKKQRKIAEKSRRRNRRK